MNVQEVFTRVQRTFGDTANVQVDQNDIIRWINDAQREIVLANQLLQAVATSNTIVGTNIYTLPTDLLTIRSIKYAGLKLRAMTFSEAEQYIPNFDDTTNYPSDIPTAFWVWANQLTLYPNPSGIKELRIYYTRQPVAVSILADIPELPLQYHNRLVEYCLQQAYELDENWAAAETKKTQFMSGVNNTKDNVDWAERDFYPNITMTEGSDWQYNA